MSETEYVIVGTMGTELSFPRCGHPAVVRKREGWAPVLLCLTCQRETEVSVEEHRGYVIIRVPEFHHTISAPMRSGL